MSKLERGRWDNTEETTVSRTGDSHMPVSPNFQFSARNLVSVKGY